ncbi:MAG: hypothetical protein WA395_10415 [Nitrososphaeraceae archaeon]
MVSGVITGLTYAQISSSNSSLVSSYSKSSVVINFDPKKGQLPEGLVLDRIAMIGKTYLYLGLQ